MTSLLRILSFGDCDRASDGHMGSYSPEGEKRSCREIRVVLVMTISLRFARGWVMRGGPLTEHGCEVAHRQGAPHGQPRDGEPPANDQILGQLPQG